jgi:hypothetical protein
MSNNQRRLLPALRTTAFALAVVATPLTALAEPVFGPLTRPNEIDGPSAGAVFAAPAPGQYLGIGAADGQSVPGPLARPNEVDEGPVGDLVFQQLRSAPGTAVPGQYLGIGPAGSEPVIGPLTRPNEI